MNNFRFLILNIGLLLCPLLSIYSQDAQETLNQEKTESNTENSMQSHRFLVGLTGNFQHFQQGYQRTIQKERISAQFAYSINKKTMIGMDIQFTQEDDYLNILDDVGFGTITNKTLKRQFQPFARRYFYKTNDFNIFYQVGLKLSVEEFQQYRNYYGLVSDDNTPTTIQYLTFGGNLSLGLEYKLNHHWVLFTLWEAIQYQGELNQEESTNDNIVLEHGLNMTLVRDLRVGLGYYF